MSIFSARTRASTWRQLWVWLAEAEKELGLDISNDAISQMREHVVVSDEAFKVANEYEKKFRVSFHVAVGFTTKADGGQHDVMAHVHAYGEVCWGVWGLGG